MRVLVCPQEFKGTLLAREAAEAIAEGIHRSYPDAEVTRLPLSDGGPGFVDALQAALGGRRIPVDVRDALLRPRRAEVLLVDDDAYIEAAQANGLVHIVPDERDPRRASTEGVGDLLLAAAREHPRRIVIGVGGSATNDGGSGMARALGALFAASDESALPPGGAALVDLAAITWSRPAAFEGIDIVVATDVTSPLLGPGGATHVFGPQKGAGTADIAALESALTRYAARIKKDLGADVAYLPGAGAAGGLAAGLTAFVGASIESGFDIVARAVHLEAAIAAADAVVTGEGRFDTQSGRGKVTGRVLGLARDAGKPIAVVAGSADPGSGAFAVADVCGETLALQQPAESLAYTAATLRIPPPLQ